MTDRQIVESIIKQCKSGCSCPEYFIDDYVKFNDQGQCTHLDLSSEKLTEIPIELFNLNHLEYLSLKYNYLTYISEELNYIQIIYIDNNPFLNSKDKVEILFNRGMLNDR